MMKNTIFFDEIQMVDNFEDVVNGVKTDFNSDLYITGSNSKLLSSDIFYTVNYGYVEGFIGDGGDGMFTFQKTIK